METFFFKFKLNDRKFFDLYETVSFISIPPLGHSAYLVNEEFIPLNNC